MTMTRPLNLRVEIQPLYNLGNGLQMVLAQSEVILKSTTISPKLWDVVLMELCKIVNVIWLFDSSWREAADCFSRRSMAGESA